ncbi:LOW QUALITY PROTEIN: Hypothetical protein PHPALM_17319 [Phytophthora palmivora]|uniref:Uncharacterized protein n=1 Tax=Phytophthora palmivora TaxID=4796 RepID=A0A2P4XMI7_9STRA|nr:LOW QUALITY PROTEIN: Hypothetical protein PHPALM_17319 [Phytophthora palmivora]
MVDILTYQVANSVGDVCDFAAKRLRMGPQSFIIRTQTTLYYLHPLQAVPGDAQLDIALRKPRPRTFRQYRFSHIGDLDVIDLRFLVKGHTKNAVDRGFGHVRKHIYRSDLDYGTSFRRNAYKNSKISKSFNFYDKPGVVVCKKTPDSPPVVQILRRQYDGIITDMTTDLPSLENSLPNLDKIQTMYRRFAPEEFRGDRFYNPPNDEDERKANEVKKQRITAAKQESKNELLLQKKLPAFWNQYPPKTHRSLKT